MFCSKITRSVYRSWSMLQRRGPTQQRCPFHSIGTLWHQVGRPERHGTESAENDSKREKGYSMALSGKMAEAVRWTVGPELYGTVVSWNLWHLLGNEKKEVWNSEQIHFMRRRYVAVSFKVFPPSTSSYIMYACSLIMFKKKKKVVNM